MNDVVEQVVPDLDALRSALADALKQVNHIVVGKEEVVNLAFSCLLADGHLLLEDLPGVGKTTLAHALAITTGLYYQRIQFTSDMLPADILGISIYSRKQEKFDFHSGPIFSQVVLADEINRATPKTQSALLEAMAERQVTIEGSSRPLPRPFFVLATQNPIDLAGTFPLPDSQLDRFLMKLAMGYPDPAAERRLLEEPDRLSMLAEARQSMNTEQLLDLQYAVCRVHASAALLDYLQALVAATRDDANIATGLSPRATMAILRCGRAWALLQGRDHCIPEDLQAIFVPVAAHRLRPAQGTELSLEQLASQILEQVPVS